MLRLMRNRNANFINRVIGNLVLHLTLVGVMSKLNRLAHIVMAVHNTYYTYDNTEKGFYTHLGVSTGYYIINGLSIEPEFNINLFNWEISASLLANLCYTFYLPQKNIYPYLKLGYGLSTEPGSSNLV